VQCLHLCVEAPEGVGPCRYPRAAIDAALVRFIAITPAYSVPGPTCAAGLPPVHTNEFPVREALLTQFLRQKQLRAHSNAARTHRWVVLVPQTKCRLMPLGYTVPLTANSVPISAK
jgi:hypothetical protein